MKRRAYVYILGNDRLVLYIGVTINLIKRVFEHKSDTAPGFTQKYRLHKLLYYEIFEKIEDAIKREKQLKNWHREWKSNLIKSKNPEFRDLYPDIV
jgi:putative endonuclease